MTQDDIIFGSYSKSKQNDLKSSPVDENDEFDENFGEFKDASSETGSKHEVLYHFDLISSYSFSMLKYVLNMGTKTLLLDVGRVQGC